MKKILVIGAGKSSTVLIDYLLKQAIQEDWHITVADHDPHLAREKVGNHEKGTAIGLDCYREDERATVIADHNLIISMLPPAMHSMVAKNCIQFQKDLITASYVSNDMRDLAADAEKAGVLLMNECGLDPGIDHMSCMSMIDQFNQKGFRTIGLSSYTGGLVAPEHDNNPWRYKFTWNPKNVIIAGQGPPAVFMHEGHIKLVPYHQLFTRTQELHFEGLDPLETYLNRDSLKYKAIYGLAHVKHLERGTIRYSGFCAAWNVFVQLGITNDEIVIPDVEKLSYSEIVRSFVKQSDKSVDKILAEELNASPEELDKIKWLGLLSDQRPGITNATPAGVLQHCLVQKWQMEKQDRDMILMVHKLKLEGDDGQLLNIRSDLRVDGRDASYTAMAKTVGLPMGIVAKLKLQNKLALKGVHIPVVPEVYQPVLRELESFGIQFNEYEEDEH